MIRKSIATLLFLLILGYSAYAQEKCEKFTDANFGISFCIPTGWTIMEVPSAGKGIYGERTDGFTNNINVRGQIFSGTVAQAADSAIAVISKLKSGGVSNIALSSKKSFTASKKRGIKVVFKSVFQGRDVKTVQYYFSTKGQIKIAITATYLWSDTELEKMIDDSIRTLKVKK